MTSLHSLAGSALVERLGWVLVHSIWQASAVAILLAIFFPVFRRRGAQAAYAACCAALFLAGLAPAATFALLPQRDEPAATSVATEQERAAGNARPVSATFTDFRALRLAPETGAAQGDRAADAGSDRVGKSPRQVLAAPAEAPTPRALGERAMQLVRALGERLSPWLPSLVLIWSLGVLALSLRNAGGWLAAQRLKSEATGSVPAAIEAAAARLARSLGLARSVRLLQSALVDSPLVIGAIRPVILLPASLVTGLPADQLESLLAHELAHVSRHDYLVNLLQSAIETLFFYHPAVWWISSQMRIEREHCCDDIAVLLVTDRTVYVRALAAVAGARVPAMTPAAGGGLLLPRLRRVLGLADPEAANASRWLAGAALLALCGGIAIVAVLEARPAQGQAKAVAKAEAPNGEADEADAAPAEKPAAVAEPRKRTHPSATTEGSMKIIVVDADGRPVPEAQIHASVWTDDEAFRAIRDYTTDAQGEATADLPNTLWILRLWASKKGYAGRFISMETDANVHEIVIPKEFTFRLPKGTTLGGVVKDEEGHPIKGAQVEVSYQSGGGRSETNSVHPSFQENTTTDADGRWKVEDAPPGDEIEFSIGVTHPDYLSDDLLGELERKEAITTRALRDQTATIVMQRGKEITGTITDPGGKPVANAIVTWGDRPSGPKLSRTNAEGVYRFGNVPAGNTTLAVVADKWMPSSRNLEIANKTQTANFQLQPGKKLRIKFVDRAGGPIPEVFVLIEAWRGAHLINNFKPQVPDTTIPGKANADGVFEWSFAPDDAVSYRFNQTGFAEARASITADDSEHVQVLDRVLRISGRVRDATTGKPVDRFLLMPVRFFRPDQPYSARWRAQQQNSDEFGLEFDSTDFPNGIQIEAPGYLPYRSVSFRVGDADPELDIRLQPAERYEGRVVDQRGRPLKDAHVYVGTACEQLSLENNAPSQEWNANYRVQTDLNGTFEIAAQIDRYGLIIVAPEGYAEVAREPSEKPGVIRVEPWAKVSGRLMQHGKPVPRYEVTLQPIRFRGPDEPRIFDNLQTTTSDDGSFVFERVPPVPCHVRADLHWSRDSTLSSSHSVPIRPKPGEEVHVTLSGSVDVSGRLVAEDQPAGFDYHFSLSYLVARRAGIEPPESLAGKGFDWRKGWSDAWLHSQEGQAYLETLHHWFVKPEPDGRFTISGVEPGDYDLAINLYGKTEGCLVHAAATRVIRVSVKPGTRQLDLGELSIPSVAPPKAGDPASDFEFVQPDGTKGSLAALRGKYVLLDFWATWCGPCVAKLNEVERIRKQFAAQPGLTVLGVNLDEDQRRVRDVLKTRQLPWRHALLGEWSSTDVPRRYGVSGIPTYVLIDPQGRIAAHDFSLDPIAAALSAAGEAREKE